MVADWIADRDSAEVIRQFEAAEAAIAPIYSVADVFLDPQYQALGTLAQVEDEDLGEVTMQNVLFRMSATPGSIKWAGRALGANTDEVLGELGLEGNALADLRARGVI